MIPLPLKQGLKLPMRGNTGIYSEVMIPLPLKQGLKHENTLTVKGIVFCYDSTSTKTRIETPAGLFALIGGKTCYDSTSTKTRIETR